MTDKEKKNKIADILMDFQEEYSNEVINRPMLASLYAGDILSFIDSLQEKPASKDKFTFTSLPRLLDRIKPTDRAKWYSSRLADALEKEGYITDAKIVRESIKLMNGEKVPMATMDEESVSEKKCMFTKDSYTDEDRKVLCEDCKEKCEYSKKEEPVSEDLGDYINELSKQFPEVSFAKLSRIAVRVAKWQKEQMIAKAIDAELYSDGMFIPLIGVKDREKVSDIKFGDKVKVIIIKED
jgi:hypothetical protein